MNVQVRNIAVQASKQVFNREKLFSLKTAGVSFKFEWNWKSQAALPQDVNVQVRNIAVNRCQ
jgi:hypothetical protein